MSRLSEAPSGPARPLEPAKDAGASPHRHARRHRQAPVSVRGIPAGLLRAIGRGLNVTVASTASSGGPVGR